MDFGAWLKSHKTSEHRNEVFEKYKELSLGESLEAIYQEYQICYGVKNSFFRFIDDIISQDDRERLMNSIFVSKRIRESITFEDGSHMPAVGERIEINNKDKKDFLFKARNSFTHKGVPFGNADGGILNRDEPYTENGIDYWLIVNIHSEIKSGLHLSYGVRRWPYLLIEIIENVINESE